MSVSTQQEVASITETATQMLDNLMKAQNAALAFLCMTTDQAIAALEAQPEYYNVASAADFRSLEFDDSKTISCTIRGWKIKGGLYIIPGLRGLVTPPDDKEQGRFIPFEQFLPKSMEHGISYTELVIAIARLVQDAAVWLAGGEG